MVKKKKLPTSRKVISAILCIAAPLIVGGVSALMTMNAMGSFSEMEQPPLAPPAWLFPVAWTILYALMGFSSYLIFMGGLNGAKRDKKIAKVALVIYGIQLAFNFIWSPLFFNLEWYWFAFGWLIAMWLIILALIILAGKVSKGAVFCLLPYILWCTFAAYLNAGIAILN
ncbi:tryptophan-rich sensory protein [Candidatus Saccharibacteria bacterium]|nr:tryptophan-rich sensory protein [Candidatus Saccharibacteria bacterium]